MVTPGLRAWFVVHFVADVVAAIPLFFAPEAVLGMLGVPTVDPMATRMVAAALCGIGIESLLCRNAGADVYRAMLDLKIIWSGVAIAGLVWNLAAGGPPIVWAILAIFAPFNLLWVYYRLQLRG